MCFFYINCSLYYCVKITQLGFIVPFLDLGIFFAYSYTTKTDSLFLAGVEYGKRWPFMRVLPTPLET
jgi:hypothetical protein